MQHDGQSLGRIGWEGGTTLVWAIGPNLRVKVEPLLTLPMSMLEQVCRQNRALDLDALMGETIDNVLTGGLAADSQGFCNGRLVPRETVELERRYAEAMRRDGAPAPTRSPERYQTNRWSSIPSVEAATAVTRAGEVKWAPSTKTIPGMTAFKAGGRLPDQREVWVIASEMDGNYSFSVTIDMSPEPAVEQRSRLLRRCAIAKLMETIADSMRAP